MENNENLPKKPSRWTMFWNPEAMQQYYDKLEKNLKQREDGLTQRENDIQQREKGLETSRSELETLKTALQEWKISLQTQQSNLKDQVEANQELRISVLEQQKSNEEFSKALETWQARLNEIQNLTPEDKNRTILELKSQMETITQRMGEQISELQGAIKVMTEETLPEKNAQIEALQGEAQNLSKQLQQSRERLKESERKNLSNETYANDLKSRLQRLIGMKEEKGEITPDKSEEALSLENDFKAYLLQITKEYEKEMATIDKYSTKNQKFEKKKHEMQAKYKAQCLGALAAYVDMDGRPDLIEPIKNSIRKAATKECERYAGIQEGLARAYSYTEVSMMDTFNDWFADAFLENRLDDTWKLAHSNTRNSAKEMFKRIYSYEREGEGKTFYIPSSFSGFDKIRLPDDTTEMGNWLHRIKRKGKTYGPDLPGVLNSDTTYKSLSGSRIVEPEHNSNDGR